MSVLSRILKLSVPQLAMAMPALAAGGERELGDNLAVWIFLGFCSLIIVAQLFPMIWHVVRKSSERAAEQKQALEKVPKS
jgi:hypothetical protein